MSDKNKEDLFYKLGRIEEGIQNLNKKLDGMSESIEKHEKGIDEIKNWQSGIASKITLIAGGAGILFSFLFDWIKNKIKG